MKLKLVPLTLALAAAVLIGTPAAVRAADEAAPSKPAKAMKDGADKTMEADKAMKKAHSLPYHGKVSAVDKAAKSITLEGKAKTRTIMVNDETKITKDGAAAMWDAITVGEEIRGSLMKEGDKEVAKTVMIGAKPMKDKKEKKEMKPKKAE